MDEQHFNLIASFCMFITLSDHVIRLPLSMYQDYAATKHKMLSISRIGDQYFVFSIRGHSRPVDSDIVKS